MTVWLVRIWTHKNADEKAHTLSRRSKNVKKRTKTYEKRILCKFTLKSQRNTTKFQHRHLILVKFATTDNLALKGAFKFSFSLLIKMLEKAQHAAFSPNFSFLHLCRIQDIAVQS